MMAVAESHIEQTLLDAGVEKRAIGDRGNGLFAGREFSAQEQIVFIQQPLISALEAAQLQRTCYTCFRSDDTQIESTNDSSTVNLKTCTGCRLVRFCNKNCQRTAWKSYHKHECPIFAALQPRVLPGTVRGVLRLLLQRQHGILPEDDWDELLTLESHQTKLSEAGGTKWENLFLMVQALKKYSNTKESIDTLVQICCIMMINSFTLTNATMDPIGVALHPLPALINHSCDPNAFIRFDMSTSTPASPPPKIHHGSISVHALRPIKAGEELRITYYDALVDRERRQSILRDRYFFHCDCPRCEREVSSNLDATDASAQAILAAKEILQSSSAHPTVALGPYLSKFQSSLRSLSTLKPIPQAITSYPSLQLRRQLVLAYIATQNWEAAMRQNIVLCYNIEDELSEQLQRRHPLRFVSKWRLLMLVRLVMSNPEKTAKDSLMLRMFACVIVGELIGEFMGGIEGFDAAVGVAEVGNGQGVASDTRLVGQVELMIAHAQREMQQERWDTDFVSSGLEMKNASWDQIREERRRLVKTRVIDAISKEVLDAEMSGGQ